MTATARTTSRTPAGRVAYARGAARASRGEQQDEGLREEVEPRDAHDGIEGPVRAAWSKCMKAERSDTKSGRPRRHGGRRGGGRSRQRRGRRGGGRPRVVEVREERRPRQCKGRRGVDQLGIVARDEQVASEGDLEPGGDGESGDGADDGLAARGHGGDGVGGGVLDVALEDVLGGGEVDAGVEGAAAPGKDHGGHGGIGVEAAEHAWERDHHGARERVEHARAVDGDHGHRGSMGSPLHHDELIHGGGGRDLSLIWKESSARSSSLVLESIPQVKSYPAQRSRATPLVGKELPRSKVKSYPARR
ncbi:hypothetical protein ACMD2_24089 [Ananas comosus]|uniref:Uncharacterized protein n=1 Tax=Ananas comosus TaxID=4615 RepID=A0A199VM88_ANACO|nr:hypothetical protein ACMD2_24089 [Ananas comosus]